MPLAATFEDDVMSEFAAHAEPEHEAQTAASQPVEVATAAPKSELPEDAVRRALLMLVDQGIMTAEQARAAYRKQT